MAAFRAFLRLAALRSCKTYRVPDRPADSARRKLRAAWPGLTVAVVRPLALILAVLAAVAFDQPNPLVRAREFYNAQNYDAAIEAATAACAVPALADSAAVVLARAHLERFRTTKDSADLSSAREALQHVDAAKLTGRDGVELLIGEGESLYFDDQFGAAAELYGLALERADQLDTPARDRLFEWWASSLDQEAQLGPESDRKPLYARILARAEAELRVDDKSPVASYWLVAAARGTDDLERAWGAALAAYVRAPQAGARGATLREDLDRLVTQVIIPERAEALASAGDPHPAMDILQAQWDDLKQKWGK